MNFSAFGGPFSGIHQFAAKFGSNDGAFTSTTNSAAVAAVTGNGAGPGGLGGAGAAGGGSGNAATAGVPVSLGGINIGQQDLNRYHGATNGNHFNQNSTSSKLGRKIGKRTSFNYNTGMRAWVCEVMMCCIRLGVFFLEMLCGRVVSADCCSSPRSLFFVGRGGWSVDSKIHPVG